MGIDTIWGGGSDLDSSRARVFISHSAQEDTFADDLRRRLASRLASSYDVLLDEQAIDPGDQWRAKLYRWLGTCEAAIILVNEAVIARPDWVRFETHVVSWRREFSDDVVVIPVLLPGVSPQDLQLIGLGTALVGAECGDPLRVRLRDSPIELTAYQFVQADGDNPDPDEVVEQIVLGLAAIPPRRLELAGPIGDWIDEVKRYLPVGRPLRQAAVALGVADQLPPDAGPQQQDLQKELVAFTLLYSSDLELVETATDLLLRDADFRSRLNYFIPLVIPSWVGEEMGLAIAGVRSNGVERRLVAMGVDDDQSIADVIRRANCCNEGDLIVDRASSNLLTENASLSLERWYESAVENTYGVDFIDEAHRPAEIAKVEESFRERDKNVFIALGRNALASCYDEADLVHALNRLRDRFPGAVFVLNAPEQLVQALTTDVVPRCSPEIAADTERTQRSAANRMLNRCQ